MGPVRNPIKGGRVHFQHGPIDLIIGAEGDPEMLRQATERAWIRFQQVLPELVEELGALRRPVGATPGAAVRGPVARRMVAAAARHTEVFITPMAAVAGAVADDIIEHFRHPDIARAYVNNGGDIALYLAPGTRYRIGIAGDATTARPLALRAGLELSHQDAARGVATSGWRGRSFSLGIADSVTVTAHTAALADAAATLVGNAVNVDSASVQRRPANTLKDDTDLGDRLVTVGVSALRPEEVEEALSLGLRAARRMLCDGRIEGAALALAGEVRAVGTLALGRPA